MKLSEQVLNEAVDAEAQIDTLIQYMEKRSGLIGRFEAGREWLDSKDFSDQDYLDLAHAYERRGLNTRQYPDVRTLFPSRRAI